MSLWRTQPNIEQAFKAALQSLAPSACGILQTHGR